MARWIVPCESRDRGPTIVRPIEHSIVPLLRHPLSHYRKRAVLTTRNLRIKLQPVGIMNRIHQWLCRSDRWRTTIRQRVPWVLGSTDLGSNVLELGPGPGLSTDVLRISVTRLTALEIDPKLASALTARLRGSNVEVIEGNATGMPFADSEFSGAASFTMLHHVPSRELQDKVLREVFRVLKPGGFFVGSDSLRSWSMRIIHIGDTLVLVDPDTFGTRMQAAGFEVLEVQKNAQSFRFRARRPAAGVGEK